MRELVLSVLLGLPGPTPVLEAQDEGGFTLAVDVDFVVFNVTVTDERGRLVGGLEPEDFRVSEDGVPQKISLFRPEDAPATVGLIIDSSGSMRERRADVAEAALAFVGASNPENEIFVVTFNENVFVKPPDSDTYLSNLIQVRAALERAAPDGMTALYDAVAAGLEYLTDAGGDRNALVVLSDGGDNASRRVLGEILDMELRSSATVYTIGIYDDYNMDRNPGVLRQIAGLTGGHAYFPDSADDLEEIWRDIAAGIRAQYTIGYHSTNPAHDGGFRSVRISAARDGKIFSVRTREGYEAHDD